MDWLSDFQEVANEVANMGYNLDTLKADKFRGTIKIDFEKGIVKVVKVEITARAK